MKAIFTYLTGGRAGQAVVVEKSYAMLGRAPQADVRFGPDQDLPVSGRHAAVIFRDGDWILRDLASTNGTFVNGVRIEGEHQLADQDLIRLGDGGPMLRFGVMRDSWRPTEGTPPSPPTPEPWPVDTASAVPRTPLSTAQGTVAGADDGRFVATVTATRQRAPWLAALLIVVVLGSLGGVATWRSRASRGAMDEHALLLAQADSLFATLDAIGHGDSRIAGALDGAKAETARLRSRIRRTPRDQQALAPLRDSLRYLASSFERLAAAAALDPEQVSRTSGAAMALVEATYEDGTSRRASAFAMRGANGRVVYVSVPGILRDAGGHSATAITLHLSGSSASVTTRALASHDSLGVAVLEAPKGSDVGTPPSLARNVGGSLVGQAAVLLGYPVARQRESAVPTTALAAVTIANPTLLQLEPLGASLAPGSLVFDRSGSVIGMLRPGTGDTRLLNVVPAPTITAFVDGSTSGR